MSRGRSATARRIRSATSCATTPVGAGQDGRELVAAVAVQPVAVAGRAAHRRANDDEQAVPGRMAHRVVERLERVQVQHQDGERRGRRLHRLTELALEGTVVAQPGQGVLLGTDLDGAVRLRVLEGDRRLALRTAW